jgi:hypothetical protein
MSRSSTSYTLLLAIWMMLDRPQQRHADCSVGLATSRNDGRSPSVASIQASPCVGVVVVRPTAWEASAVCG